MPKTNLPHRGNINLRTLDKLKNMLTCGKMLYEGYKPKEIAEYIGCDRHYISELKKLIMLRVRNTKVRRKND